MTSVNESKKDEYGELVKLLSSTSDYYVKLRENISQSEHRHPFDVMSQIVRVLPKHILMKYSHNFISAIKDIDCLDNTYTVWNNFGKILDEIREEFVTDLTNPPRWYESTQKIFNFVAV